MSEFVESKLIGRLLSTVNRLVDFEDTQDSSDHQLSSRPQTGRSEKKLHAHKTFSPEELVARFPLFAGLTPEQRETLILHFLPKTASPGDRIIRSGDKAEAAYFLSAGEVEVAVHGRQVSKLGAGSFFGEMALLSGERRSADVTALDFCKYLALSQRDFRRFVRKYPSVYEQVVALAKERGNMNRQFLDDLAHGTAPPLS